MRMPRKKKPVSPQLSLLDLPQAVELPTIVIKPKVKKTGAELRDEGMERATAHADAVASIGLPWREQAAAYFRLYAKEHRGRPFLTEDVRAWAESTGFAQPPDQRSWGSIARSAALAGVVRKAGSTNCRSPSGHNGPRSLWIAT